MWERGITTGDVILSGHPLDADLPTLKMLGLGGWLLKPATLEKLARLSA